jgi:hypothetical protein
MRWQVRSRYGSLALMKSRTWLRIAAILLAVHTISHTLGTLSNPQVPGADVLINSMRNFHFDAMGWDRTAWDFFRGLDLLFSVNLAVDSERYAVKEVARVLRISEAEVRAVEDKFLGRFRQTGPT